MLDACHVGNRFKPGCCAAANAVAPAHRGRERVDFRQRCEQVGGGGAKGRVARYFCASRSPRRVIATVVRFPLRNVRLERRACLGDISAHGLKQSHGLKVNALYDLAQIVTNRQGCAARSPVAVAQSVQTVLPGGKL
ncbi:MAG: malonyl-CoA decarboxylase family protein [Cypionkella sp.]